MPDATARDPAGRVLVRRSPGSPISAAAAYAAVSEALSQAGSNVSVPGRIPAPARAAPSRRWRAPTPGRHHLPRLPGELRPGRLGGLAAGRGLPGRAGPLGGSPNAAMAANLSVSIGALRAVALIPTFRRVGGSKSRLSELEG